MVERIDFIRRIMHKVCAVEKQVLFNENVGPSWDDRLKTIQSLETIAANRCGVSSVKYHSSSPQIAEHAVDNGEIASRIAGSRNQLHPSHTLVRAASIDWSPNRSHRLIRPSSSEWLKPERVTADVGDRPRIPIRIVLVVRQSTRPHPNHAAHTESPSRPINR